MYEKSQVNKNVKVKRFSLHEHKWHRSCKVWNKQKQLLAGVFKNSAKYTVGNTASPKQIITKGLKC